MEAGESGTSQSGFTPANKPEHHDQRSRESVDRAHIRSGPVMATAALINPSSSYHHHSPYSPSYPPTAPGPSSAIPSMMSPVEPRRMATDEAETSHRQSLPSLSEVISGAKPSAFAPPVAAMLGSSQNFPSPFTSAPQRSFPDPASDKNASPRPLHPTSTFAQAQATAAFSDSTRPPNIAERPVPPPGLPPPQLVAYHGPNPPPMGKPEGGDFDQRQVTEGRPLNGSYSHPAAQSLQAQYSHAPHLPPGQRPLPEYPISPRHGGPPALPSPFEPQRQPLLHDDRDPRRFETHYPPPVESSAYNESLQKIASSSRTVFNFAEAYGRIASEQHGQRPIPERLPTEREVSDMLHTVNYLEDLLKGVRNMVQQSILHERAREGQKAKSAYDDDDMSMYGDGGKTSYVSAELGPHVKKRRGRAAPPGRCHSCNRIDTPEWRRGPDGARTLCNACGLHYAKLERKRQLEARSIRPKPSDERN